MSIFHRSPSRDEVDALLTYWDDTIAQHPATAMPPAGLPPAWPRSSAPSMAQTLPIRTNPPTRIASCRRSSRGRKRLPP